MSTVRTWATLSPCRSAYSRLSRSGFCCASQLSRRRPPPEKVLNGSVLQARSSFHNIPKIGYEEWSAAEHELHKSITSGQIDAQQHLASAIDAGSATPDLIRVCLDAEYARMRSMTRHERLAVLNREQKQIARTVLKFIWSGYHLWVPMVTHDQRALSQLCYFALAEDIEDLLQSWITVQISPGLDGMQRLGMKASKGDYQFFWRNYLFRAIVQAHLIHEVHNSADKAITSYLNIASVISRLKSRHHEDSSPSASAPAIYVSKYPALVALSSGLIQGWYEATSPELWDEVAIRYKSAAEYRAAGPGLIAHRFMVAALALHHPARPHAKGALDFLRSHFSDTSEVQVKEIRRNIPAPDNVLVLFMNKCSELARTQGQVDDSPWVDALRFRLVPARPLKYGRNNE